MNPNEFERECHGFKTICDQLSAATNKRSELALDWIWKQRAGWGNGYLCTKIEDFEFVLDVHIVLSAGYQCPTIMFQKRSKVDNNPQENSFTIAPLASVINKEHFIEDIHPFENIVYFTLHACSVNEILNLLTVERQTANKGNEKAGMKLLYFWCFAAPFIAGCTAVKPETFQNVLHLMR